LARAFNMVRPAARHRNRSAELVGLAPCAAFEGGVPDGVSDSDA
jgi:hypothetical protein